MLDHDVRNVLDMQMAGEQKTKDMARNIGFKQQILLPNGVDPTTAAMAVVSQIDGVKNLYTATKFMCDEKMAMALEKPDFVETVCAVDPSSYGTALYDESPDRLRVAVGLAINNHEAATNELLSKRVEIEDKAKCLMERFDFRNANDVEEITPGWTVLQFNGGTSYGGIEQDVLLGKNLVEFGELSPEKQRSFERNKEVHLKYMKQQIGKQKPVQKVAPKPDGVNWG